MNTTLAIAGLAALLVMLLLYTFIVPKGNNGSKFNSETDEDTSLLLRAMGALSNDLYDALPEGTISNDHRKKSNPRVESLIVRSGNPWNIKAEEFVFLQYLGAVLGFLLGWIVWLGINVFNPLPWFVVVPLVSLFCYFIPKMKYNDVAKARDLEFKQKLPEALDLLIISLSGGKTLQMSIREVIPNMAESILRDEFINIVNALDSGKTLHEALDNFANRAPNDSILTFIRSVQSASEVNAPLVETLESRASASRQELFALIHQKTAMLESKIFMILTPTLMPAVMIISIAPSAASMMTTL